MKKLLLMAMATLLIGGLQAQGPRQGRMTPEKIAEFETTRMVKQLNLDKETEKKISEINLRFAKEQSALRQNSNVQREEIRKQMQNLQGEKDKALEQVLSSKDFEAYKKNREEMRKRMIERRANGENNDGDSGTARDRGTDNQSRD
jgi:NACalpha-BTF3-like transcription factor